MFSISESSCNISSYVDVDVDSDSDVLCEVCKDSCDSKQMLLCDECDLGREFNYLLYVIEMHY